MDMVDQRFADARRLLAQGKPGEAAVAARKLLDPHQATVVSAAQHLLYADALRRAGQFEEAAEAYGDILKAMPERISFAAAAALRAGASYDSARRGIYARDMYDYCLTNYALAIEEDEFEQVAARLAELEAIYEDPMAAVATMMGDARQKLQLADSGQTTQQAQREAAAILEDLIRTMEEKDQQNSSNSQGSQRQRQQKEGSSSSEQQKPATGSQSGNRPSSPMENSRLVPGKLPEPSRLANIHDSDESGDWASLPPRKREAIQQIMRKTMSDRYRRIVSDYHRRLAKEGSE
jgi:tetratricopeptide (TPR) repeat protein